MSEPEWKNDPTTRVDDWGFLIKEVTPLIIGVTSLICLVFTSTTEIQFILGSVAIASVSKGAVEKVKR